MPTPETTEPLSGTVTPTLSTLLGRAMRLTCPRCGTGEMYQSLFRMHERCPHCQFRYERGPGYFLGSAYLNYGLTALLITVSYLIGRFHLQVSANTLAVPLAMVAIGLPLLAFRYARAGWLALDCYLDVSVLKDEDRTD